MPQFVGPFAKAKVGPEGLALVIPTVDGGQRYRVWHCLVNALKDERFINLIYLFHPVRLEWQWLVVPVLRLLALGEVLTLLITPP